MADAKIPKTIPCKFNEHGWAPCKTPTTNGWCTKHEKTMCCSCGEKATQSCMSQMGGLACGSPLCDNCRHVGSKHVTKEVADEIQKAEREEEQAKIDSRTSPDQRIDKELAVPVNLFELLKGDWEKEYKLGKVYFLALKHGLYGFFPAVYNDDKEVPDMIFTDDLQVLKRVWESISPRDATIRCQTSYCGISNGFTYCEPGDVSDRENSAPCRLLSLEECGKLIGSEKEPFRWTYGLMRIGGHDPSRDIFNKSLEEQAVKFNPSLLKEVV